MGGRKIEKADLLRGTLCWAAEVFHIPPKKGCLGALPQKIFIVSTFCAPLLTSSSIKYRGFNFHCNKIQNEQWNALQYIANITETESGMHCSIISTLSIDHPLNIDFSFTSTPTQSFPFTSLSFQYI